MIKAALSVKEVGIQLGISLPKAYELTNVEGFPVIKVGRRKIVPIAGFQRWLESAGVVEAVPATHRRRYETSGSRK